MNDLSHRFELHVWVAFMQNGRFMDGLLVLSKSNLPMNLKCFAIVVSMLWMLQLSGAARIRMPDFFSNGMVLQ